MQTGIENRMKVPQEIKNGTALWPSDSTSKGTQNTGSKEYMHPYAHCSIIHNSQDMEAAQVSINRQVDKKVVVNIDSGILLSHK